MGERDLQIDIAGKKLVYRLALRIPQRQRAHMGQIVQNAGIAVLIARCLSRGLDGQEAGGDTVGNGVDPPVFFFRRG